VAPAATLVVVMVVVAAPDAAPLARLRTA